MTDPVRAENGSPEEHPLRTVLRRYVQIGKARKAELEQLCDAQREEIRLLRELLERG